jgi:hypothetical protein
MLPISSWGNEAPVQRFRPPDWEKPIMTGVWGLGYSVSLTSDVVLLSNGASAPGNNPDQLWLFILMRNGKRDFEAEQGIQIDERLAGILECRTVNKECILGTRERHFEELLAILRKDFRGNPEA